METVIKNGWYGTAKKVWITGKCLRAENRHEVWAVGCPPVFRTSVVLRHPLYEWLNYQMNLRVERIVVQRIPEYQTWSCKTQLFTNQIFFTIIAIFLIWTEEIVDVGWEAGGQRRIGRIIVFGSRDQNENYHQPDFCSCWEQPWWF